MEKLNIAELLKDCPKGMELDCTMWDNLYFDRVENDLIHCYYELDGYRNTTFFCKNGCYTAHKVSKCVIFPKGKTTWEGFQRPFKDGDILVGKGYQPFIFKKLNNSDGCFSYCGIDTAHNFHLASSDWTFADSLRFATEEEKQKLFDAIKANGYKWNPETKTLEKLKVSKFDITTLKPFDKVLVRNTNRQVWSADLFSHMLNTNHYLSITFVCLGHCPNQCIPFEGNEHLLGTTSDCDEYFKTWE